MIHPDMLSDMAEQHSRALVLEADRYRQAHPDRVASRTHHLAWPWQRWQFQSPIVRRPCSFC